MGSVEAVHICCCYFDQSSCEGDENRRGNCFKMMDYLKVLTTELRSAQVIIKILQDELKSKVDEPMITENLPMCVNFRLQDKHNSESENESGWTEIRRNNHITKQPKKTFRCLKQINPYIHLDDIRFAPLRNLQEQVHQLTCGQDKSKPTQLSKISGKNLRKVYFWKTINKGTRKVKQREKKRKQDIK